MPHPCFPIFDSVSFTLCRYFKTFIVNVKLWSQKLNFTKNMQSKQNIPIYDECQAKIDLFKVKKIGKFLVFKIV